MSDKFLYARQLDEADIHYLATRYDFTHDFIRGLSDADWCDLLGCGHDELPFYLFDENTFDDYLSGLDTIEVDDDFGGGDEDEDGDGFFDLNYFVEKELTERPVSSFTPPASRPKAKPAPVFTSSRYTSNPYASPSRYAPKRKPLPSQVKHHFELVH
jgi:hypothetical protein